MSKLPASGARLHRLIVRMGCLLGYHATEPRSALFIVQPHPSTQCILVRNTFTASTGGSIKREVDCHGNVVLRTMLAKGYNEFRQDAICIVPDVNDNSNLRIDKTLIDTAPIDVLRYTIPSRYCESDKLAEFALQQFGQYSDKTEQAQAVCDWVHHRIEYRFGSGDQQLSACDVLDRGYGVCRDFAHLNVALCRALDIPARYVAGYVPRLAGCKYPDDSDIGIDFHAYAEIWLGGHWHTFDARHNRPLRGRVKVAHGMDAADTPIAAFYGAVDSVTFRVWADEVESVSSAFKAFSPLQEDVRLGATGLEVWP